MFDLKKISSYHEETVKLPDSVSTESLFFFIIPDCSDSLILVLVGKVCCSSLCTVVSGILCPAAVLVMHCITSLVMYCQLLWGCVMNTLA